MDENEIRERISAGRAFITNFSQVVDDSYQTDQQLKKPQPPLAKAPMAETALDLPKDFSGVEIERDFLHIVNSRKSHRVYTEGTITLEQLSFLLWCTQGVKSVRGRSYATLRTVPGGGARHPFECYMAVRKVEGLQAGLYHYLPMTHRIEYLGMPDDLEGMIGESELGGTGQCRVLRQLRTLPRGVAIRRMGASHCADRQRTHHREPVSRCHSDRIGWLRNRCGGYAGCRPRFRPGRRR